MKIIQITEKEQAKYNQFVNKHQLGSVHQTWQWGEFQTKLTGRDKFWCIAVESDEGKILASALVIRQTMPMKKCWFYCPRGPLADYPVTKNVSGKDGAASSALQLLLNKIRELARQNNAVYLRFDPPLSLDENIDWKALKSHPAHAHYQPENTLILDLKKSSEELLKEMKPKGRYNIKIAQKHGVHIRVSDGNEHDIDAFYNLLLETTSRDQFSGHNKKFYEDMLTILGKNNTDEHQNLSYPQAKLYLAEYQGKIVAGIIVTFFKNTAIYYFGASGNEHRNLMAPYLLQWQAIEDAKKAGCTEYDFLGIAPEEAINHPWAGVTDFKLKFGGKRINYQPSQEIIYQLFWYHGIKIMKRIKGLSA